MRQCGMVGRTWHVDSQSEGDEFFDNRHGRGAVPSWNQWSPTTTALNFAEISGPNLLKLQRLDELLERAPRQPVCSIPDSRTVIAVFTPSPEHQ